MNLLEYVYLTVSAPIVLVGNKLGSYLYLLHFLFLALLALSVQLHLALLSRSVGRGGGVRGGVGGGGVPMTVSGAPRLGQAWCMS